MIGGRLCLNSFQKDWIMFNKKQDGQWLLIIDFGFGPSVRSEFKVVKYFQSSYLGSAQSNGRSEWKFQEFTLTFLSLKRIP